MCGVCNIPLLFSGISSICLLFQTITLRSEVFYATKSMRVLLASFGSLPRSNPFLNSVFLAVDSRLFSLKYYNSTNELLMLRVTCTRLKNIHIKDVQIIFVI